MSKVWSLFKRFLDHLKLILPRTKTEVRLSELFTKNQSFRFICSKCNSRVRSVTLTDYNFSKSRLLCVHLSPHDTQFINYVKINAPIHFDPEEGVIISGIKFKFVCAIIHYGNPNSGHYTTVIKKDKQYYEISDSNINEYDKKILGFLSNVYFLFLEKII